MSRYVDISRNFNTSFRSGKSLPNDSLVRKAKNINKNIDAFSDEQIHFVKTHLKDFLMFFGYCNPLMKQSDHSFNEGSAS